MSSLRASCKDTDVEEMKRPLLLLQFNVHMKCLLQVKVHLLGSLKIEADAYDAHARFCFNFENAPLV